MTALSEYERLESGGLWRADDTAQRREVTVSFGNATLVIADMADRPLTHWSLAAVRRLNPKQSPALFAPDADGTETLEIEDDLMIDAIEKVRNAIARARPQPGRLRLGLSVGVTVALIAAGVFWLPNALTDQTVRALPESKRAEIGAGVLGQMQRLTGPRCNEPAARTALAQLHKRLFGPAAKGQIIVLPDLRRIAVALPGKIIAIDRRVIENADDPAVPAGYILAAAQAGQGADPMAAVLRSAGLRTTLSLLTTGELPPETLVGHARQTVEADPQFPSDDSLIAAFEVAKIPTAPFAYARDDSGQTTRNLIAGDAFAERDEPEILSDSDWIRLQGICNH